SASLRWLGRSASLRWLGRGALVAAGLLGGMFLQGWRSQALELSAFTIAQRQGNLAEQTREITATPDNRFPPYSLQQFGRQQRQVGALGLEGATNAAGGTRRSRSTALEAAARAELDSLGSGNIRESGRGAAIAEKYASLASHRASSGQEGRAPELGTLVAEHQMPQAETDPIDSIQETSPPRWHIHAEQGNLVAAFQELDAHGGFDVALARASQSTSSDQLMTLADIARFAGMRGRAIQALRVVTEQFPQSAVAPIAAMTLGHLLAAAGDQQGAAQAYALSRHLSPRGDFAEDALAREIELALQAHELDRAGSLLQRYAIDYPDSPAIDALREESQRLRRELVLESELDQRLGEESAEKPTDAMAADVSDEEASDSQGVDGAPNKESSGAEDDGRAEKPSSENAQQGLAPGVGLGGQSAQEESSTH
ncbi:MAG: hypothetical protein MK135_17890, partial [Polyangiaceae bacterium]|nr:hypothetical protein [Polyangiaceae bacterium]